MTILSDHCLLALDEHQLGLSHSQRVKDMVYNITTDHYTTFHALTGSNWSQSEMYGFRAFTTPRGRVDRPKPIQIFGLETDIPRRRGERSPHGPHHVRPEDVQQRKSSNRHRKVIRRFQLSPAHLSWLLGVEMVLLTGVLRSTHPILMNHLEGHDEPRQQRPPKTPIWILGMTLMNDQESGD